VRNWKLTITGDEYEASCLGDAWAKPEPVFWHWNASAEAIYDPSDTNGQLALQNAMASGTKVVPKFYIDGTNYWAPDTAGDSSAGAYIKTVGINQARASVGIVDFTLNGYGPIKQS
jgi:hypothetical protein